jgi:hypothetical protein
MSAGTGGALIPSIWRVVSTDVPMSAGTGGALIPSIWPVVSTDVPMSGVKPEVP